MRAGKLQSRRQELGSDPDALLLLGEQLEGLGLLVEAREAYTAAWTSSKDSASQEHLDRVERSLRPKR